MSVGNIVWWAIIIIFAGFLAANLLVRIVG